MKESNLTIKNSALETIALESKAIANLSNLIDNNFVEAVQTLFESKGRIIITGIGKSAIIGNKIVATLNSTGTPAVFMHAADAIHGDLGIIQPDDIVICISKSGNTPEIKVLVPLIKNYGNSLIAITGNTSSFLAQQANYVLNTYVEKEACTNNLAPTTSTTAQLVMGDAIAVCLQNLKKFSSKDFAKYHPGGALGKKLYLRVNDLIKQQEAPKVSKSTPIMDVIVEITKKRLGATAVLDQKQLVGIVTDGDIRRMIKDHQNFNDFTANDIMSKQPKSIASDAMAADALHVMEDNDITHLVVLDTDHSYMGIIHLHDIIKEGIL